jgi:TPP-dependent pyruvate/acetoin dehydrogenase alpha subunit
MGDGGTSEGDFHVALNFAGVMKAPVVLICQNNQWAISTPGSVQTAAETIALKALGYGVEPLRADGNDVLAVYDACRRAAIKARAGDGPTFVELLTYRVSAHSSSDDPTRYRDENVTEVWKHKRDPLRRLRLLLEARGWLAAGESEALAAQYDVRVREVIAAQEAVAPPAPSTCSTTSSRSRPGSSGSSARSSWAELLGGSSPNLPSIPAKPGSSLPSGTTVRTPPGWCVAVGRDARREPEVAIAAAES